MRRGIGSRQAAMAALAVIGLTGCNPTSLLVEVSLAGGREPPAALRVSAYESARGLVVGPTVVTLGQRRLPGTLVLEPLDDTATELRVLVDGLGPAGALSSQAAGRVRTVPGVQARLALTLDQPLPDSDGDGVPDTIDGCLKQYDPDQRCGMTGGGGDLAGDDGPADLAVPTDGGAVACPVPNLFCDDFETGNTSRWSGVYEKVGATVRVDTVRPHQGAFSLHGNGPLNALDGGTFASSNATIDHLFTIPTPEHLYARAFVFSPTTPGSFALFLALFRDTTGFAVGTNSVNRWVIAQDQGASPDKTSTVDFVLNSWHCIELALDYPSQTTPAGRARLFLNGTTILDFTPATLPDLTSLQVGLVRAPGNVNTQLFIDDVALALEPIGCQ